MATRTGRVPLSVLDLAPIVEGGSAAESFQTTVALAQAAERAGYRRFWLAEHHSMPGIASAATSVLVGHVAGHTRSIRVGAGGIMLPNHSPLVIAEQFGTLETLYPGRIDLGLGRAPGTDHAAARALRRGMDADRFPDDVQALQAYFRPARPGQAVQAVPGAGLQVPLWILGSSLFGAQLAASLGLPYAFASHFAPAQLADAAATYRQLFQPSEHLREPYLLLAANLFAAESEAEARTMMSSVQQAFARLRRGDPGPLPRPVASIESVLAPGELALVGQALSCTLVGTLPKVRAQMDDLLRRFQPDELMVTCQAFDREARIRALQIGAEAMADIGD